MRATHLWAANPRGQVAKGVEVMERRFDATTIEGLQGWIRHIEQIADDDDGLAHVNEDDMRAAILKAVATGRVGGLLARELCALALTTDDIKFHRWCA
jgi:hypothetical protein